MSIEALLRKISPMRNSFLLFAVAMLAAQPLAAADLRVGYVDMQRVMVESKAAQDATKQAERSQQAALKKLEAEKRSIDKLQEAYKRDEAIMSDSQREGRQKEIVQRAQAYQKMAGEMQQDLGRENERLVKKALDPVNDALNDIAKKENLQLIFERTDSGLLFVDPDLDLTDQVIRRVNR